MSHIFAMFLKDDNKFPRDEQNPKTQINNNIAIKNFSDPTVIKDISDTFNIFDSPNNKILELSNLIVSPVYLTGKVKEDLDENPGFKARYNLFVLRKSSK